MVVIGKKRQIGVDPIPHLRNGWATIILDRKSVLKILTAECFGYDEYLLRAAMALTWCGVHWRHLHLFHLNQINFNLGILWYRNKPYPIQPESVDVFLDWIERRRQKGKENIFLSSRLGRPYKNRKMGFDKIIYTTPSRWIGCPILLKEIYISWQVNFYVNNKNTLNMPELMEYFNLKSVKYFYWLKYRSLLLGEPPCEQYKNRQYILKGN